jgi:hypothetical protein
LKPQFSAPAAASPTSSISRIADAEAVLVGHPDIGDAHRIETHQPGCDRVDGHLVRGGQQDVFADRLHDPRPRAVPDRRSVHNAEQSGVDFFL